VAATLSAVQLSLWVGGLIPSPAPASLVQALQHVKVTIGDTAPSGFELTFHAERYGMGTDDPLLSGGLLKPHNRVILVATINGIPRILVDGFITGHQYTPGSTLTVSGEDVSIKMDLFEMSIPWPFMVDTLVVAAVLAKYMLLGILPIVVPSVRDLSIPLDHTPLQNSTDRAYVQQLAKENGYVFFVVPGPSVGLNMVYWGPPIRASVPPIFNGDQKALSVDMGPFTNVESMSFSYDSTGPTISYGMLDVPVIPPVPVAIAGTTRFPALASDPALGNYGSLASNPLGFLSDLATLKVRGSFFQHQGRNWADTLILAQIQTDMSVDNVVTAQGSLDTVRYGDVLKAPGLVAVRGAGASYDGMYYVKQVTHRISSRTTEWDYKQDFVLTREGMGSTIPGVSPS
jgi:hypothetical protein